MNIITNNEKFSVAAESFMAADFFDFEAEHSKTMQDPCLACAYKISDKFAEIANKEKLKVAAELAENLKMINNHEDSDEFETMNDVIQKHFYEKIEQVQLNVERRMNALVLKVERSYLAKVKEAESASLGKTTHVGLQQFPAGGFSYAKIA